MGGRLTVDAGDQCFHIKSFPQSGIDSCKNQGKSLTVIGQTDLDIGPGKTAIDDANTPYRLFAKCKA